MAQSMGINVQFCLLHGLKLGLCKLNILPADESGKWNSLLPDIHPVNNSWHSISKYYQVKHLINAWTIRYFSEIPPSPEIKSKQ